MCPLGDSAPGIFRQQRCWLSVSLSIIINLPARLKNEQPNGKTGKNDHAERYKKSLHGLHSSDLMVENDSVPADGINCP
jgi:hypothetical protein